jgi:hypothetical protein
MRRLRPRACSAIAVALALAGCAATEPSRTLHRWTDAAGSVRYTEFPEDVPRAQRHTLEPVQVGTLARWPAPPATPVDVAAARSPAEPPTVELPVPPAAAPAPDAPPAAPADPLDARIAELEARIETEQEALKALISDPAAAPDLRSSPELREIGERLPALQGELEKLRDQRARAAEGDGG